MKKIGLSIGLLFSFGTATNGFAEGKSHQAFDRQPSSEYSSHNKILGELSRGLLVRIVDEELGIVCYSVGMGGGSSGAGVYCMPLPALKEPSRK